MRNDLSSTHDNDTFEMIINLKAGRLPKPSFDLLSQAVQGRVVLVEPGRGEADDDDERDDDDDHNDGGGDGTDGHKDGGGNDDKSNGTDDHNGKPSERGVRCS